MTGSWSAQIKAVRPFTIHGDIYWELQITRLDDPSADDLLIRVPQHAAKTQPAQDQRIKIEFLMGQVTSVTPLP